MTNPNLARNLLIASGAAIACLGLTACGGQAAAESTPPVTTLPSPETRTDDAYQTSVTQTYMPNGTRYTYYADRYGNSDYRSVLAYCDGASMVEITSTGSYGGGAGAVTRTPDTERFHPCDDGRLDARDFEQK